VLDQIKWVMVVPPQTSTLFFYAVISMTVNQVPTVTESLWLETHVKLQLLTVFLTRYKEVEYFKQQVVGL